MRVGRIPFALRPFAALCDERLQIGATVGVVISPLHIDIKWTIVVAVAVFIDLKYIVDLIAACIGRLKVVVLIKPANTLTVPPTFDDVELAVTVYVDSGYLV